MSIRRRIDENIVLILKEFGIITKTHRYPGEPEKPLKYPAERIPGPFQKLKRALTKKENKDRQCFLEIQEAIAKARTKSHTLFGADCL